MSETFTQSRFATSLATFVDYFRDLTEASFDNHSTKLRLLVNFFEHEDPLRAVATFLHETSAASYPKWIKKILDGSAAFELPKVPSERASHSYLLIYNLKRRYVEMRSVLSRRFAGSDLNTRFENFAAFLLKPFGRYIEDLGAAMIRIMERDDPQKERRHNLAHLVYTAAEELDNAGASAAPATNPAPATPAPTPAPAPAPVRSAAPAPAAPAPAAAPRPVSRAAPERRALAFKDTGFERCIRDLTYEISFAGDFDPAVQVDLMTDLKMLNLELKKHFPNRTRMVGLLDGLKEQAALREHATRAIAELGKL